MARMSMDEVVRTLMQDGKGILAADESTDTANKRLEADHIETSEESRRRWRELLFTTPGIENFLNGAILFDETLRQSASDGTRLPDVLAAKNILVGIKVDQGLADIEGGQVTTGLDGLAERINEYQSMGVTFAKWRAVARVGDGYADQAIKENAKRLAEYASVVQKAGLVPIIEPEVLRTGSHTAEDAEGALIETVAIVCDALKGASIDLAHVILKSAMAVAGDTSPTPASPREVAERTVRALTTVLPQETGGVVFLSGGQAPEEACANLNAIARLEPLPWPLTFSFSRALQDPVMAAWGGKDENFDDAQALFVERLSLAALADAGGYSRDAEGRAL